MLYELLTGKRAFEGETITETIAKVLESEPNWDALPDTTPWPIRSLLRRCLTKDPHDRLDGISNVRVEIKLALQEPATESPTGVTSAVQPRVQRWAVAVGLVVGAVVAGLATWLFIQPSSPEQVRTVEQLLRELKKEGHQLGGLAAQKGKGKLSAATSYHKVHTPF